jgi:hypothetical protein
VQTLIENIVGRLCSQEMGLSDPIRESALAK